MKKWRKKKLFFARLFLTIVKQKCSYLRPLLSITFPQEFRNSKNIGHPTLGSGGKKTGKRYLKSEQIHGHTDRRTNRLIESIGPEGRCFEKLPQNKAKDSSGCSKELFSPEEAGDDLQKALLSLLNMIKDKQEYPIVFQDSNITTIHKNKAKNNFYI